MTVESVQDQKKQLPLWMTILVKPALIVAAGAIVIVLLGLAQKVGWISAGGGPTGGSGGDGNTRYICPMMCTPPTSEPGRCPVCEMELVPATSSGGNGDDASIDIAPAARRIANIRTASVKSVPLTRTIRAIGQLSFDESTLKTISAYVDGRLDKLYADYTGFVVEKGEHLALVYAPKLYSSQAELLIAKKSGDARLYQSAKRRVAELGVTTEQIAELEKAGEADSRMHVCAPISGTMIEKFAVEGDYVKEGQPICRLADLSRVWLMLELFPEDAAVIREGQVVQTEVQSLPGRKFDGRVTFIDPTVDLKTRTVSVRVVMQNGESLLRVGDYADATIDVDLSDESRGEALVIPRNAVLMAGGHSVVYVETDPGRFELRRVTLGPSSGEDIVIETGLSKDEQVATRGNFLIDSQMQLAGNPSLIDPTRVVPEIEIEFDEDSLPPIGAMEIADTPSELPQMELPQMELVEPDAEEAKRATQETLK